MRLLVPTRICIALRKATTPPVSTRTPNQRRKPITAAPATDAKSLQQLFELSKLSDEINLTTRRDVEEVKKGVLNEKAERRVATTVRRLSDNNEFSSIEKLLGIYDRSLQDNEKTSNARVVGEVIWAAALAKSLHALHPSILDWIEKAIRFIPEPLSMHKESMIWLLSIIRGDLPMLQQLQKESSSKRGKVGPEIEREKTLRYGAMNYLDVGKDEDFRSLWTSSSISILGGDDQSRSMQHSSALLHHALLRNAKNGKPDPAMLRWYAESLVEDQRTPIPMNPQFEIMMGPVIRALGGRIERWREDDKRKKKLRKWRDDYGKLELENLVQSLLGYMRDRIEVEKHGNLDDLSRLEKLLARLDRNNEKRRTVVVDWLNLSCAPFLRNANIDIRKFLPSYSLVFVGRQRISHSDWTPCSPVENDRIKVIEVTGKREKKQELDDVCSMILAVATRGHLMSNDLVRPHVDGFIGYLKKNSMDINQSILLKNYLNDAVLRHSEYEAQPVVDHSRSAQWIDKEKKELAFTVSRIPNGLTRNSIFRSIDYYSLRID